MASEAPRLWRSGEHERVKAYLRTDLELLAELREHGCRNGTLKYTKKDYGQVVRVRLVEVRWK